MPADPENHRRILVIDDTEAIHSDFKKILGDGESTAAALEKDEALLFETSTAPVESLSFSIDSAYQGQEGLERVRQAVAAERPYPLAFVDVRMPPGWDGIETIEHIWREYPDLQVVICTAYSDYSWQETIQRLGQSDRLLILKKPFDSVEVRQLACALTEKWKLTRQARLEVANLHRAEETVRHKAQELQAALDALDSARNRELQLMASIPSICIGLGGGGMLTDWNLAAEKVFGLPAAEVVSQPFSSLPIAWPWERIEEAISSCRTEDQPVCLDEVRFVDQSGRERILGLTLNRIGTPADGDGGVVVVGADVTEHKHLQSQVQLAQKMESIGQLAAGIAHEVNTPIQFVTDNTVFLQRAFAGLIEALNQGRSLLHEAGEGSVSRENGRANRQSLQKGQGRLSCQASTASHRAVPGRARSRGRAGQGDEGVLSPESRCETTHRSRAYDRDHPDGGAQRVEVYRRRGNGFRLVPAARPLPSRRVQSGHPQHGVNAK